MGKQIRIFIPILGLGILALLAILTRSATNAVRKSQETSAGRAPSIVFEKSQDSQKRFEEDSPDGTKEINGVLAKFERLRSEVIMSETWGQIRDEIIAYLEARSGDVAGELLRLFEAAQNPATKAQLVTCLFDLASNVLEWKERILVDSLSPVDLRKSVAIREFCLNLLRKGAFSPEVKSELLFNLSKRLPQADSEVIQAVSFALIGEREPSVLLYGFHFLDLHGSDATVGAILSSQCAELLLEPCVHDDEEASTTHSLLLVAAADYLSKDPTRTGVLLARVHGTRHENEPENLLVRLVYVIDHYESGENTASRSFLLGQVLDNVVRNGNVLSSAVDALGKLKRLSKDEAARIIERLGTHLQAYADPFLSANGRRQSQRSLRIAIRELAGRYGIECPPSWLVNEEPGGK